MRRLALSRPGHTDQTPPRRGVGHGMTVAASDIEESFQSPSACQFFSQCVAPVKAVIERLRGYISQEFSHGCIMFPLLIFRKCSPLTLFPLRFAALRCASCPPARCDGAQRGERGTSYTQPLEKTPHRGVGGQNSKRILNDTELIA